MVAPAEAAKPAPGRGRGPNGRGGGDLSALVLAAQGGDDPARDALVRRFQDMAFGVACAALGGDADRAQDPAQEAFVEALRTLPALREPLAFPAWLRLLVRKHCDRIRRRERLGSMAPLEWAAGAACAGEDPAEAALLREERAAVRAAVAALPTAEREAVWLFYAGDRSCAEIAGLLGVPVSTVKNRLWTARRRLKERMTEQIMGETLKEGRPSGGGEAFRGRVFARLLDEYRRQRAENPEAVDRSLLEQARKAFDETAAREALDAEAVHSGAAVLLTQNDAPAVERLLRAYLARPSLPPTEEAWARWHVVRSLAMQDRCEEVVAEQGAFLPWLREKIDAGAPLLLGRDEPFYPLTEEEARTGSRPAFPREGLLLLALNIGEVGDCFAKAGRLDGWLALSAPILDGAPRTPDTRTMRAVMRSFRVMLLCAHGRHEEALAAVTPLAAIAEEEAESDPWEAERWRLHAAELRLRVLGRADDVAALRVEGAESVRRLDALASSAAPGDEQKQTALAILRHNLGSEFWFADQYDLAAPLLKAVVDAGSGVAWTHFWLAACLRRLGRDRSEVLPLLRSAAARRWPQSLAGDFAELPEFAEVKDDPEFLAALRVS